MKFEVLTIFPEVIYAYVGESILKRAQEKKLIEVKVHNLRDFTNDRHRKVDSIPYGGGPGMVLKFEPIHKAIEQLKKQNKKAKTRVVLFSTRGPKFDAKTAKRLTKYDRLIMICGRYEGVDERVADYLADEEISIGDFVLAGGELPAMIVIEAVSRFIPGVLGKHESLEEIKGSYPVYTRPEVLEIKKNGKKKLLKVPKELIGGNHAVIQSWREKHK